MAENRELVQTLKIFEKNLRANLHTAAIAKVMVVKERTIDCKPVVNRIFNDQSKELPVFIDVPPIFMQGGSSRTRYPISVGDYCLLLFCERSISKWYNGTDFESPDEIRSHDYSDAFALVGVNPKSSALQIPENTEHDGDYIVNGDLTVNGNIICTGDIIIQGISFLNHVHGGVTAGGANTGVPQ